jgi:hypothetical protein
LRRPGSPPQRSNQPGIFPPAGFVLGDTHGYVLYHSKTFYVEAPSGSGQLDMSLAPECSDRTTTGTDVD